MKVTMQKSEPNAALILIILSILSIFPPLATDMYLSAFGDIQNYLKAWDGAAELSLSVFFLGLCIGQLIFGPLIDRYGRKRPLLVGVLVYCLATAFLLLTHSASVFIGLRFLQALGACAGMVVGRAVISDLYEGADAARKMTLLVMLITLGPIVSPLLGGILITHFGWKSVFLLMLAVGCLALLLVIFALPETRPAARQGNASLVSISRNYWGLLTSRSFTIPALVSSFVQAAMFSFITASSSVFQGILKLDRIEYGLTFGFVALGLVVASILNNHLLKKVTTTKMMSASLPLFVAFGLVLLLVAQTHPFWPLILSLWLTIAMVGLSGANGTMIAMDAARGQSGVGSALVGAVQFGVAFICSALVASATGDSVVPLALGITLPAMIASLLWFGLRGRRRN